MKETLSALVDTELKAKEREKVLDMVIDDVEMRAAWGRYHVMRAVLRKEWNGELKGGFSAQVLAALESEPDCGQTPLLRVVKAGSRGRQMVRFALAASFTAVAALFGLRMAVLTDHAPALPLKTALTAPLLLPHSYIERAHWQGSRWRNRLNAFLLEHAAVAPLAGMNGLSYVRLAAYNGPRASNNAPGAGARNKP